MAGGLSLADPKVAFFLPVPLSIPLVALCHAPPRPRPRPRHTPLCLENSSLFCVIILTLGL